MVFTTVLGNVLELALKEEHDTVAITVSDKLIINVYDIKLLHLILARFTYNRKLMTRSSIIRLNGRQLGIVHPREVHKQLDTRYPYNFSRYPNTIVIIIG